MPFLTQGETNWKYILIVLILAVVVGGRVLWWVKKQEVPLAELPEVKKPEEMKLEDKIGMIAYIKDGEIWIKKLPDGESKQLTTGNRMPRWASSGQWLAYLNQNHQLQVIRISGADKKVLNNGNEVKLFAWSPISDILAYVTKEEVLWVVNTNDWIEQKLVPAGNEPEDLNVTGIVWSPDGQWLAYTTWQKMKEPEKYGYYEVLGRIRVDGSKKIELFSRSVGFGIGYGTDLTSWSSDGEYILFWSYPFSASLLADGTSLETIPASGGELREIVSIMLAYPGFLDISPEGKFLVVTIGGGRESWTSKGIALIELSTGDLTHLTDEKISALSPVFSPDGKQIAYVAALDVQLLSEKEAFNAGVSKRQIWIMNSDGSNKRQLTSDESYYSERPLWSADGNWILFVRVDQNNQAGLWLMRSDGSELTKVAEELTPIEKSYYSHTEWDSSFDWWRKKASEEITKDETANWKTYRNEEYGFEMKCPKNWNLAGISEDPFNMTIWEGDGFNKDNIQMVEIYGFTSRGSVEENLNYLKERLKTEFNKLKEISIIGGKGFYWINETKGGPSPSIYFVGKNQMFLMNYNIYDISSKNALSQAKLLFHQMLSTFRFLE